MGVWVTRGEDRRERRDKASELLERLGRVERGRGRGDEGEVEMRVKKDE